jgi:hypothetical protein
VAAIKQGMTGGGQQIERKDSYLIQALSLPTPFHQAGYTVEQSGT